MNKLTRKSISLLLSGTMFLCMVAPVHANYVEEKKVTSATLSSNYIEVKVGEGEYDYIYFDKSTGVVINAIDKIQEAIIPEMIDGVSVTRIGEQAFSDRGSLTTITIPDSVTSIGKAAFARCRSLTSVTIPDNVTIIDEWTFQDCNSLTTVTLPEGITTIGYCAFLDCNRLKFITIPDSVTNIGDFSFKGCHNLTSFTIPDGVTTLGDAVFMECSMLATVVIPDSVTSIGGHAFFGCDFTTIDIPDSVTYIGEHAFSNCSKLITVSVPKNVRQIDTQTFFYCKNLTTVFIPVNVESFGANVFDSSNSITDIFYGGSQSQWSKIERSEMYGDGISDTTTIHYNSSMTDTPTPDVDFDPEISYHALPTATHHTSYLTAIHDINATSTLISGNLPKGLGLYEDGVIGGIPQETGTFEFVIATSEGKVGYSITVEEPTAQNVESNNDFDIIERVPTVDSNEKEYIFEVTGEFSDFLNVYLDGELLVKDVHYFSEEGSTKITIAAQTMSQLDSGSHVINATFATTNATVPPSVSSGSTSSSGSITTNSTSQSANVSNVAQVFEKTVEPAPMMAMPFSDVAVSDWHYQYVRYMYDTSTFSGVTDTTYEPNTGMTRAMMAVVFYGMANKPSTGLANFSDVADGEWYADAVNWISTSGIDDSIGTFRPTDLITREETAKMMYNFCTDQGIFIPLTTSRTPSDMNSVSETAKNAVNILFSKGIFAGDDANNFNPHNTSTRAEISAMMRTFMWATV